MLLMGNPQKKVLLIVHSKFDKHQATSSISFQNEFLSYELLNMISLHAHLPPSIYGFLMKVGSRCGNLFASLHVGGKFYVMFE